MLKYSSFAFAVAAFIGVAAAPPARAADEPLKASIALNWVPEPEFGGIYAAALPDGPFAKRGFNVDIKPGGAGAPTWQRVALGQVDFAVSSADEVAIARAHGADIVGVFTCYQTSPQGIMTHAASGFKSLEEVLKSNGSLAVEVGVPYSKFLEKTYAPITVKRVPYTGGIVNFLADKNFSQQCFVTSEPLAAMKKGGDPKTFLVADSGYNPYTGVIICKTELVRTNPAIVSAMVADLRQGWRDYLKDAKPANEAMAKLNSAMDAETFAAAADAQKPLIETEAAKDDTLGSMTVDRWDTIIKQLVDLKVIDAAKAPAGKDCMAAVK